MKLNNKGFTVVELLTSFTLTMIIVVFLFQIVLELKDVYVNDTLEAKVIEKNAIVATTLNNKLKDIVIVEESDPSVYNDPTVLCSAQYGTNSAFKIKIPADGKGIIIGDQTGDQTISMPLNTKILSSDCRFEQVYTDDVKDNAYLKLSYVVTSDYLDKDITFNYVYGYNQGWPSAVAPS